MNHGHHPIELAEAPNRTDHSLGPDHARVVLVEYGDYECTTCKEAAPAVERLLRRYAEKVRFIFRHFPIVDEHSHALAAAEAAECAGGQGKFWEMHRLLFEHQTHLDLEHLLRYGTDLGLDVARYTAEIDDEVYRQRVLEHIDSGKRSGVRGTPTFFLNARVVDVSNGLHSLADAVDAAVHARRGRAP